MPGFASSIDMVASLEFVKIHGVRRSGTNFAHWLLEANFDRVQPLSLILGWKHGPMRLDERALDWATWGEPKFVSDCRGWRGQLTLHPQAALIAEAARKAFDARALPYLLISRNPITWFERCQHLRRGFMRVSRDPKSLAKLWNDSYGSWLDALPPRGLHIRMEDLVADPDAVLQRIGAAFDLTRRTPLRLPADRLKPGDSGEIVFLVPRPTKVLAGRRALARILTSRRAFRRRVGDRPRHGEPGDLAELKRHLNTDLARRLGYDLD